MPYELISDGKSVRWATGSICSVPGLVRTGGFARINFAAELPP